MIQQPKPVEENNINSIDEEKKQEKQESEEETAAEEEGDLTNATYQVGELVDVHDDITGAWFKVEVISAKNERIPDEDVPEASRIWDVVVQEVSLVRFDSFEGYFRRCQGSQV